MTKKVEALFDFDSEPGTGELSIRVGEKLTVTRTDVGEGWYEGYNSQGECGLFPETYVTAIDNVDDSGPPSMAPPPLPPDYVGGEVPGSNPPDDDNWGWPEAPSQPAATTADNNNYQAGSNLADPFSPQPTHCPSRSANTNQAYDQDDWDSDFDDDNGTVVSSTVAPSTMLSVPKSSGQSGSTGDVSSIGRSDSKKTVMGAKTSFNRFSTFVKSGGENFVLGKINANVQESDVVQVVEGPDGSFGWLNVKPPYSCAVASPKKESKLKGLKSFIAYQLTPSFNNIQVSRRYKHFDWLHERLVEKFTFIPIPPLPDKQIQGRYEGEFIEHRMNQLQSFVDRVCRHPVLSQSEVWQHFLTCTDEKRWKNGKRKAEKDALVGGSFFMALRTPDRPVDVGFIDHEVEVFSRFTNQFDCAVKNMLKTTADQTQKCQNYNKREYQTIGKAFQQLGQALEQDGNYSKNPNLTNAITCTGEAYEEIGRLFEEQPRNDWEPLGDMMHDYRGTLAGWPGIMQIHAGSLSKKRDCDRLVSEGKIGQAEANEIGNRADTLSHALLAEINTFHHERTKDMKTAHQHFLKEQIAFYNKVVEKLQDSLRMFDNC